MNEKLSQIIEGLHKTGADEETRRQFNLYTGLTIERTKRVKFGNTLYFVAGHDCPAGQWLSLRELHRLCKEEMRAQMN